jgi:2-polyprenyl-3-methyl-5-hydroxy-6-metoxy-1,4-benzoquinol methylase
MIIPESVKQNEYGFYEVFAKPTPAEMEKYYADQFYQDCVTVTYAKKYTDSEPTHINNKNREASTLVKRYFGSDLTGKKYLDIGCGEGFTVKHFRREGCTVLGLDYSDYGIQSHSPDMLAYFQQCDILAYCKRLIEKKTRYDIINLDNVLEHVTDPVGLPNDIGKLLEKQGILRIRVPNDFSLCQEELLRLNKVNRHYWISIPGHLSYFNAGSLKKLLAALNFETLTVLGDYPIEFFLFNDNTNYVNNPAVGKSCHESRVRTENFLYQADFEKAINLYEAMGEVGIGRGLTFYVTKSHITLI